MQFDTFTDQEVLALWADIMGEMKSRSLVRSSNSPIADYAESLVAKRLGLTLEPSSTASYDAKGPDGIRYQIKARRLVGKYPSRQLSAIRNLEQGGFDYLVAVLFGETMQVKEIWKLPHTLVCEHAKYSAHVNAHRIHVHGAILKDPRAERLDL